MALTNEDLSRPIDWRDAKFAPMLEDLQGHILKHHGRDHTNHLFLRFEGSVDATKAAIRTIGNRVLTALAQLQQVEAHKTTGADGGPVVLFYLSAAGYAKLGLTPPNDPAFGEGMQPRGSSMSDPDPVLWEEHLREPADALLIVADVDDTKATQVETGLLPGLAAAGIVVLGRDVGRALKDAQNVGHEHFGYTDGISQPLMLDDEVDGAATEPWDPRFGPGEVVLVRDPHGAGEDSFGSYLVYRKLEQRVRDFKIAEYELADQLGLTGDDGERAGAMVIGRFENGTPLAVAQTDVPQNATNNFVYGGSRGIDPDGLRCPFHGHIRKTNPRGDTGDMDAERTHLMARRGIPYGERADDWQSDDIAAKPNGGVGLIFMAFNQEIERQFEFTQILWANNPNFAPGRNPGLDPVIGQGPRAEQTWRQRWDDPDSPTRQFLFDQFVTLRGGDYFFAPSVGFMKNLQ